MSKEGRTPYPGLEETCRRGFQENIDGERLRLTRLSWFVSGSHLGHGRHDRLETTESETKTWFCSKRRLF